MLSVSVVVWLCSGGGGAAAVAGFCSFPGCLRSCPVSIPGRYGDPLPAQTTMRLPLKIMALISHQLMNQSVIS